MVRESSRKHPSPRLRHHGSLPVWVDTVKYPRPTANVPDRSHGDASSHTPEGAPLTVAGVHRYLSLREAAIYLNCSERKICLAVKAGALKASRLGRCFKFRIQDLDGALEPVGPQGGADSYLDSFIADQTDTHEE